jgi:hypothetical protein
MFTIAEIEVHQSIAETKFACDLNACKGACCTFPGGRGAPLQDDEVLEIEKAFPIIKSYLPELHTTVINTFGLIDGNKGNYATQCVDGKACVFVYYDNNIAKCAFESAFYKGEILWQKPLSCHLFPIRIGRTEQNGKEIHFEFFSECTPALNKGREENIALSQFVSIPLERVFGKEWTEQLNKRIEISV